MQSQQWTLLTLVSIFFPFKSFDIICHCCSWCTLPLPKDVKGGPMLLSTWSYNITVCSGPGAGCRSSDRIQPPARTFSWKWPWCDMHNEDSWKLHTNLCPHDTGWKNFYFVTAPSFTHNCIIWATHVTFSQSCPCIVTPRSPYTVGHWNTGGNVNVGVDIHPLWTYL